LRKNAPLSASIGLGYVGLPLIVEFALKDYPTIGFEVDEKKVNELNKGNSHIVDVPSENVRQSLDSERFKATTDFSELNKCDIIIICVPTPLRKTKDPDMSFILGGGRANQKIRPARAARDSRINHLSGNDRRNSPADARRSRFEI
jgi:UDP-N-acetyl-D-glucosamine dehydrogenase